MLAAIRRLAQTAVAPAGEVWFPEQRLDAHAYAPVRTGAYRNRVQIVRTGGVAGRLHFIYRE